VEIHPGDYFPDDILPFSLRSDQVRGIPASGKSTVLNLLHTFIRDSCPDMKVYRIDSWPKSEEQYTERLDAITNGFPSHSPCYLLFDEGQDTYDDSALWNGFFKSITESSSYRIVVFCSFGSPSAQTNIKSGMPDKVHDRQRLQLLPTKDFPYGLFLTRAEFDDMITLSGILIKLADEVCDSIFAWTRGHVGSVEYFLSSIRHKVRSYNREVTCLLDAHH
jgi:hypothetical protein